VLSQLEAACRDLCEMVNARRHRETCVRRWRCSSRNASACIDCALDAVYGRVRRHPAGQRGLRRLGRRVALLGAHELVARVLHDAHIGVTQGDSYRLAQATSGKGARR
jgi:hypothetical protein